MIEWVCSAYFASIYTVDVDHGSMINENEAARGEIGLLLCLTSPHATTPPTLFLLSLFYHPPTFIPSNGRGYISAWQRCIKLNIFLLVECNATQKTSRFILLVMLDQLNRTLRNHFLDVVSNFHFILQE